jgi:hypothetical protein
MHCSRPFSVSTALLALVCTSNALAQPPPTGADTALQVTVAKALLDEGKKLMEQGLFKEARDKLEASARNHPSPEALLQLAACQEKLGATASAWGTYHRAEHQARMEGDKARTALAVKRMAALEPRLSRVKVVVPASETPPSVTLDDRALASEAWGVALPLDPGSHTLAATRAAKPSFTATFDLSAGGETREVIVPDPSPPPAPKPEAHPQKPGLSTYAPPAPGEVLPILPRWPAPSYSDPWVLPSMKRTFHPQQGSVGLGLVIAGAVNVVPIVAVGMGGGGQVSEKVLIGLGINGGVGLLTGIAGLIVLLTDKHHSAVTPLPLQAGPFVARSGGGLSLQGAF